MQVAEFVDRAVQIAVMVKEKSGGKLKDFRTYVDTQARHLQGRCSHMRADAASRAFRRTSRS